MILNKDELEKAVTLLSGARRIHCICHRGPDGDAVGALLAISLLLENQCSGIPVLTHCKDPIPDTFLFLPRAACIRQNLLLERGDVILFVDCAVPKQTEYHESHSELFDGSYPTINIDHHPGSGFGSVNLVDTKASSSCEIIFQIAGKMHWPLTADIATCLLTGIYTDTGGLLHSNTTAAVYRAAAALIMAGARQQQIVKAVYRTSKLSTLKLWGRVLEKINLSGEGGAVSAVTRGDFRATGADASELNGAIDYVNAVPGMKFSLILSERDDGKVKGSLRTLREDIDVSAMAGKFDGGGHRKAAGFALEGKLQPETRWKVVRKEEN